MLLLVATLTGMFVAQSREIGRLGALGYFSLVIGSIFLIGTLWGDGFFTPVLASRAPHLLERPGELYVGPLYAASAAAYAFSGIGFVLFGITSYRAWRLPRAAVALFTIGGLGLLLPPEPILTIPWAIFIAAAAVLGAGLVWIGVTLPAAAQRSSALVS
jgi:NADH:ubiquinone oxidoreductase subunit H